MIFITKSWCVYCKVGPASARAIQDNFLVYRNSYAEFVRTNLSYQPSFIISMAFWMAACRHEFKSGSFLLHRRNESAVERNICGNVVSHKKECLLRVEYLIVSIILLRIQRKSMKRCQIELKSQNRIFP